jgi:hypothetical protein
MKPIQDFSYSSFLIQSRGSKLMEYHLLVIKDADIKYFI